MSADKSFVSMLTWRGGVGLGSQLFLIAIKELIHVVMAGRSNCHLCGVEFLHVGDCRCTGLRCQHQNEPSKCASSCDRTNDEPRRWSGVSIPQKHEGHARIFTVVPFVPTGIVLVGDTRKGRIVAPQSSRPRCPMGMKSARVYESESRAKMRRCGESGPKDLQRRRYSEGEMVRTGNCGTEPGVRVKPTGERER